MIWKRLRNAGLLTVYLGAGALGLAPNATRAYFGFGFGLGQNSVPSPTDFLNQQALIRASSPTQRPNMRNPYGNSPNAHFNRARDPGYVPSYDVARRVPATARASRPAPQAGSSAAKPQAQAAPAPTRPVVALANFFNAARQLVWPSNAPVTGELQQKRDLSDAGCLAVLDETQAHGSASLGLVAASRQQLLDYGQPALQYARTHSTPALAETFHSFLLSLYDALARAAETSKSTP
jgi:hypothetical protein